MTAAVRLFTASIALDLRTVRIAGDDDFAADDLAKVVDQALVRDATVRLFGLAEALPGIGFAVTPGHLRSLAAGFRLARVKADHVDGGSAAATKREKIAQLIAGKFNLLWTCRKAPGGAPIGGIRCIVLLRPTRLAAVHNWFLSQLDLSTARPAIVDPFRSVEKFGLLPEMTAEAIETPPVLIARDPIIDRLADMPMREAQRWADGDPARVELVRAAKGYASGWSYHTITAHASAGRSPAAEKRAQWRRQQEFN